MLNILIVLTNYFWPLIIGYLLLTLISRRYGLYFSWPGYLALSWGLGAGVTSELSFLIMLFSGINHIFFILSSLVICLILGLLVLRQKPMPKPTTPAAKLAITDWLLLGICGIVLSFIVFKLFAKPLGDWDAWAIWRLRAKYFFLNPTDWKHFFSTDTWTYSHLDYPLLVPLMEFWMRLGLSNWHEYAGKFIHLLFCISYLLIFWEVTHRYLGNTKAILLLTMFCVTDIFYTIATAEYADLALSYYIFCSAALLFIDQGYANRGRNILAGLSLGFACWTKNEGQALSLAMLLSLILTLVFTRTEKKQLLFLGMSFLLANAALIAFRVYLPNVNDLVNVNSLSLGYIFNRLDRLKAIIPYIANYLFLKDDWNILWWLLVIGLIFYRRQSPHLQRMSLLLFIGLSFSIYIFIYLISPDVSGWHLRTSFDRVVFHFAPIAFLLIADMLFKPTVQQTEGQLTILSHFSTRE